MCRLAAYMGPEILISSLVTEPKHSIIHQSYQARERVEPLNGDGFGIGWYASRFSDSPAVFKEVSPAWSNQNLKDITRVTESSCIFAHVRAATIGGQPSRANCHPFSWKNYLFMHNGTVHGFNQIKRTLRRGLSDEAYSLIKGETDTEHVFALFIDRISGVVDPSLADIAQSLQEAISIVEHLKYEAGVTDHSTLNLVLTDGVRMVATRYISHGDQSNSLYISRLERFYCKKGIFKMEAGNEGVLVVSEPLDEDDHWQKVKNNHLVLIDENKKVKIQPIVTGRR